jgi:hypothetical protein
MDVDLEEKEERGTFEIKGGGKVHLRLLLGGDMKAIRKATMTTVPEYPLIDGKYQRFEAPAFDGELFEEMKNDLTITGWDNIRDRNTKVPVPITKENKTLLMEKVPEFAAAVNDGLKALKESEANRAEAAEKN